jgi:hypothetical protein
MVVMTEHTTDELHFLEVHVKLSWNELWRSEVVIAKKNRGRLKKKTKKLRFRKCSTTVRRDWRCW